MLHRGRISDVAALRGLSLRVMPGERTRRARPERIGQIDVAHGGHRPGQSERGTGSGCSATTSPNSTCGTAVELRTAHVGVVSQRSGLDLLDDLDCRRQRRLAGPPRRAPGSRRWNRALQTATLGSPGPRSLVGLDVRRHCRAVSVSGSRWPQHSRTAPARSSPTSRRESSTLTSADEVYDFLREHAERTSAGLAGRHARCPRRADRDAGGHDSRRPVQPGDGRWPALIGGRWPWLGATARQR